MTPCLGQPSPPTIPCSMVSHSVQCKIPGNEHVRMMEDLLTGGALELPILDPVSHPGWLAFGDQESMRGFPREITSMISSSRYAAVSPSRRAHDANNEVSRGTSARMSVSTER